MTISTQASANGGSLVFNGALVPLSVVSGRPVDGEAEGLAVR